MSFKKEFANKLKQIRRKKGLTQEKLAELVGVAPRHISFIETAKSFPSADLIEKICKVLKINYSELFKFEENLSRDDMIAKITQIAKNLEEDSLRCLYKIASEL